VIERRGRDLDLAPRRRRPIFRDHLVQQLELDRAQQPLVLLGEVAALGDQTAHARVLVEIERIEPGELLPHLQVAQVVAAEPARRRPHVRRGRQGAAAQREQLRISGVDVDHALALRMEEILEDEGDVCLGQLGRRLQAQIQEPVVGAVLGERLELDEQ
jgi:hypothetical protein